MQRKRSEALPVVQDGPRFRTCCQAEGNRIRWPSVTSQGSWPPESMEIDWRPDKQSIQGFAGVPAAAGCREQTTDSLAGWLRSRGRACSLREGLRVGVCPRVRPEGWLRFFAHPLAGVGCKEQVPAFAPGSYSSTFRKLRSWHPVPSLHGK